MPVAMCEDGGNPWVPLEEPLGSHGETSSFLEGTQWVPPLEPLGYPVLLIPLLTVFRCQAVSYFSMRMD
ncbi:MAG: hypothetical protein J5952_02190 [Prevotella sp.]|nr:hypothetical protein [Prevotella sp.]